MKCLNYRLLTAVVVGLSCLSATANAANLILNGDFSQPSLANPGDYNNYGAGSGGITDWTVDTTPGGGAQLLGTQYGLAGNGYSFAALPAGPQTQTLQLFLNPTSPGGIQQTITGLTPGPTSFTINFDVGARYGTTGTVGLYVNNTLVGDYSSLSDGTYQGYSVVDTLLSGSSLNVDFRGVNGYELLADVSATAVTVPEPASLVAILGLGGMGLIGLALRRRRNKS